MRKNRVAFVTAFFALGSFQVMCQSAQVYQASFSIESRITNLLQGGYEIGLFYNTKSNFSFGLQYAAQEINSSAKEIVFQSSNHENLDIRLSWLAAIKARYHLSEHREGFYLELSSGLEQFKVSYDGITHRNENGFILPSIGYLWYPWGRQGFYVNANIGCIYAFSRPGEKIINDTSYELRPFFPSPALSVGWKF